MNTFETLVKHNEHDFHKFIRKPFFELLKDRKSFTDKRKQVFLNCVQVFSNEFQKILFARTSTCIDIKFSKTFDQHLREELGHDELLMERQNIQIQNDAILQASSSWFVWQMFARDNLDKTVLVHLVLELSGDYYHDLASYALKNNVDSDYFQIHKELDEFHANMGVDLLEGCTSDDYQRLIEISHQGWQMLGVMVDRTHQLVMQS